MAELAGRCLPTFILRLLSLWNCNRDALYHVLSLKRTKVLNQCVRVIFLIDNLLGAEHPPQRNVLPHRLPDSTPVRLYVGEL